MTVLGTGTEHLLARLDDRVAILVLNRPERRNAISVEMLDALAEILPELDTNEAVGAIVLTGAGESFCAGGDVKAFADHGGDMPDDNDPNRERWQERRLDRQLRTVGRMRQMSIPIVAALPGAVAGAGLSLALACDLRVGSPSTLLTTAFVKIALSGDFGASWLLERLVGPSRARRLMLLSERLDGTRAYELGLLDRLVPVEELATTATDLARTVAGWSRPAVSAILDNVRDAEELDLAAAMRAEVARYARCADSAAHREAVAAFAGRISTRRVEGGPVT